MAADRASLPEQPQAVSSEPGDAHVHAWGPDEDATVVDRAQVHLHPGGGIVHHHDAPESWWSRGIADAALADAFASLTARADHWQHQFHVMGETAYRAELRADRLEVALREAGKKLDWIREDAAFKAPEQFDFLSRRWLQPITEAQSIVAGALEQEGEPSDG